MDADPYLKSAGIASDWPCGRGCYQSADGGFIIWFGEEDQLRIMCMKKGTKLNEVFDRLKKMLDTIESIDGIAFATSSKYGYVGAGVLRRRPPSNSLRRPPGTSSRGATARRSRPAPRTWARACARRCT